MPQVLRVRQGVGLRENASVRVTEESDFSQVEGPADGLDVFDHVLDRVQPGIFETLRSAAAPLVDEDETVAACERQKVRQEIIVRGARAAVDDEKRCSSSDRLVVDEDASGVHEALFLGKDCRPLPDGCQGKSEKSERRERKSLFHAADATPRPTLTT